MNSKKVLVTAVVTILVLLLLPVIFNEKINFRPIKAPDASELEYSEVFFENPYEGFQLAGRLFLPEGDGPFPTAIYINGSGSTERNNSWYLAVAEHLRTNGIAVLIPDKRGCEKSEGEWVGASIEDLATDTLSAVEFVKHQKMFEYSTIGLVGFSQGGWIAPVAATKSDDLAFVVSVSGNAVTTDETLYYQTSKEFEQYTYKFIAKLIVPLNVRNLKQKEHLSALYPFDPIPYLKEVQIPVFYAISDNDPLTPAEENINRLHENDLDQFQIKVYPDGQHGILDPQKDEMSEEFLNDLVSFIKEFESIE